MNIVLSTLNSKYIHSSLAVRYLSKELLAGGINSQILEFTINDSLDYIINKTIKSKGEIFCFSCYIWNIEKTLEICSILKSINENFIIILGGPEVSFNCDAILKENSFIDFIIKGEGEKTIFELLNAIKSGLNFEKIEGIAYKKQSKIIINKDRKLIKNLDEINSPYTKADLDNLKDKIVYYETSRGCPYSCHYCISSTFSGVRYFSLQRVFDDLKLFFDNNVRLVKFVDRTFNADKKRTLEIFKFCLLNHKNTRLHFEIYADLLNDEIIDFLKTVPKDVFQFEIGIQSTNENTLQSIDRKQNLELAFENIKKIMQNKNINIHLDLIVGLPYETINNFEKSFNEVYNLKPNMLQIGFLKLLFGTKIRENHKNYNYKFLKKAPYTVLSNDFMTYSEIFSLKKLEFVFDKFYNSGYFKNSLDFAIKNTSPFEFYKSLTDFFDKKEMIFTNISLEKLYELFAEYYNIKINEKNELFLEYLKLDYFSSFTLKTFPKWAKNHNPENFNFLCFEFLKKCDNIKRYLSNYENFCHKQIFKYVDFYVFKFDRTEIYLFDKKEKKIINISEKFV